MNGLAKICIFALLAVSQPTFAAMILPNVPHGTQYQIIFVTDGKTNATSNQISYYNDFATAEALRNPLLPQAEWHAVVSTFDRHEDGSTTIVTAAENAPLLNLPIYDTQGNLVAAAGVNLYDGNLHGPPLNTASNILSAPRFSQFGSTVANHYNPRPDLWPHPQLTAVWTGGVDQDWHLNGNDMPSYGFGLSEASMILDGLWLGGKWWLLLMPSLPKINTSEEYPIYALSGAITAVPEPNTVVLCVLGVLMVAARSLFVHWRGHGKLKRF